MALKKYPQVTLAIPLRSPPLCYPTKFPPDRVQDLKTHSLTPTNLPIGPEFVIAFTKSKSPLHFKILIPSPPISPSHIFHASSCSPIFVPSSTFLKKKNFLFLLPSLLLSHNVINMYSRNLFEISSPSALATPFGLQVYAPSFKLSKIT